MVAVAAEDNIEDMPEAEEEGRFAVASLGDFGRRQRRRRNVGV